MKKVSVLIVDDSAFMRKVIQDMLSDDSRIEVIGTARNGNDALKKIRKLKPDVVTLDIEMPQMDGIEALKIIMRDFPTPVVMLSSTTQRGADNTFLAMQYGAVDFIAKPSGPISLDLHKVKDELISKVLLASRVQLSHLTKKITEQKTITRQPAKYSKIKVHKKTRIVDKQSISPIDKLICIGTSTGGPRALQTVLTNLPGKINATILIVQHMPPGFTKSLANRLNTICEIDVKEAENGDVLKKGTAYIAPGGFHMKVEEKSNQLVINLDESEPRHGHRPAVDVLFESLSSLREHEKVAVIMTGMGSDGAKGLSKLKLAGNVTTIAESEKTSIVFGMPKAAIDTNHVDEIHDLEKIAATILKYV